jgi:hypothetical protein
MAAHAKTEIARWATSRSVKTAPVIIEGQYYKIGGFTATTTNHVAIGDLVVMTANKVDEIEYCADNGHPFGIVLDSAHNWAELEVNNPGVALTKELYFNDTSLIDVAIPLPGTIISVKVEATQAFQVWGPCMAGATGSVVPGDDTSHNIGHALVYYTSGTGTDAIAMYWGSCSLSTKAD